MPVTRKRHNISKVGPNPVDEHVGAKIRARRELIGMTQKELGEATNITFQQIQKYERGVNRTSASRLFQFSRLLETSIDSFFEGLKISDLHIGIQPGFADNSQSAYTTGDNASDDIMSSKETIALVKMYYEIDDQDSRKKIMAAMRQMIKAITPNPPQKTK